MITTNTPKKIRVMFTPFRDGLQCLFGGKVRLNDFLPAVKASADAGVRHFEFGGGARFQAPLFYLGEDPFEDMKEFRKTVGSDAELQILTRSVSGVTLTTQSIEGLKLQGKLMHEFGTTYDRNFDYMNDVRNLINTGRPIVEAGMHNQVCIAIMGLPFHSDTVHTPEFYINIGKQILNSDVQVDSICLKDASGTTSPKTIYDTAVGLKKIMPPEMPLWLHTHDTASTAVVCYLAGIQGGVDGVDVSLRPLASGTSQPDIRAMAHTLKGTGYTLDVDTDKMNDIEKMITDLLHEYNFNPTTTSPDARVLGFPMPGGAIGPNIHMMVKAGIEDKYSDVLAEFPIVVEAGGAWTSVTPGSQQYWLQAFNNVLHGRWKQIEQGYGMAILGYFGRTPLSPDPEVIKIASEQLGKPPLEGDPLEAAPNNIEMAISALKERNIPINDKNIFLVLSSIVPGKKMELNEGIRLLTGKSKIDIPLKPKKESKSISDIKETTSTLSPSISTPVTTRCVVEENGHSRTFNITLNPTSITGSATNIIDNSSAKVPIAQNGTKVYSVFKGEVDIVDILVNEGDLVAKDQIVAAVEAMKMKHNIIAPCDGKVSAVHANIGDTIDKSKPILTLG